MKAYRIKNWASNFETSETRKLENLRWVPTPNKHDGLGYRKLASKKNACELFSAWNLMLQVASKGEKNERGWLKRESFALNARDLSDMTGFPVRIFEKAFEFFTSEEIAWLEYVELTSLETGCIPDHPGDPPDPPGYNPVEGKEGKERREGKCAVPPPADETGNPINGFAHIPSEAEVVGEGRNFPEVPEGYCRHFFRKMDEDNRWLCNGRLVKWKKKLRYWWDNDRYSWKEVKPLLSQPSINPELKIDPKFAELSRTLRDTVP